MFATVEEIAAAEKINASYVGRVLRLTLLAPDIVEAILDGRQPAVMMLAVLNGRGLPHASSTKREAPVGGGAAGGLLSKCPPIRRLQR